MTTFRRLAAALLLLALAPQAWGATRTSTQAGNTHTAPLAFGVIPSSGDFLVCNHAVNEDGDLTLGSTTAGGAAIKAECVARVKRELGVGAFNVILLLRIAYWVARIVAWYLSDASSGWVAANQARRCAG